jgi:hypothetical protein
MPQDRESGDKARLDGHKMAKLMAEAIGAELIRPGFSNEAILRIELKFAHIGNPQIGITEPTLARVSRVVAAIQDEDGRYSLFEVTADWYQNHVTHESSRQAGLLFVLCSDIRREGHLIGKIPGV